MRLVHIITALDAGGAETFLARLLKRLPPRFETSVISLSPIGAIGESMRASGVSVSTLGMTRRSLAPGPIFRLRDMLKEAKPDIVQTWMYHADLLGGLAARWAGSPALVWSIRHSNLSVEHNGLRTVLIARACSALSRYVPDRILCCAEVGRLIHVRLGYANDKMEVVPNGFDLSRFKPTPEMRESVRREFGVTDNVFIIAMIGRFHVQKGHHILIDAAAILRERGLQIHYLLAGEDIDDSNVTLARWLSERTLQSSFSLLGNHEDIPRLLAAVDAFVLPAICGEGFPNVVGEAMASAVPCIASNVGDVPFIIGDTGFIVPPGDAGALANAMDRFLSLPERERRSYGARARQRVVENFEIGAIISRYVEFYDRVLENAMRARTAQTAP
jgi:glycosyltransferase involved in cell wall biosynthesis